MARQGRSWIGQLFFLHTLSINQPVIEHLMGNISFLNLLGLKNTLQKRKQTKKGEVVMQKMIVHFLFILGHLSWTSHSVFWFQDSPWGWFVLRWR